MPSEKQREASRTNGAKSKGPKTPEGKKTSSMNNLRHGLRSNQVVLPGESAAEFQAEFKGWRDDWKPRSHTTAVLVERAAIGSWRLRRCVRAESDLLMELAERAAARRRRRDGSDDDSPEARAGDADGRLGYDAAAALAELRSTPEGVDRLLARWADLARAIAGGEYKWCDDEHFDLMILFGRDDEGCDPAPAGPLAVDSHRLCASNSWQCDADRLPDAEAVATAARIGEGIARERAALAELRRELAEQRSKQGDGEDDDGVRDDEYRFPGVTHKIMLLHRYEMAHERSVRAALKDLVMLEKARPELGRAADCETEVISAKKVRKSDPEAPAGSEAGGSEAPDEPEPGAAAGGSGGPRRAGAGRRRHSRRPRRRRSRR
jgi:hypothetical protein